MFHIIKKYQAREIVKNYKQWSKVFHPQKMGVNPRGLKPQTLWQINVMHILKFKRLVCVHITINTFFHAIHTTVKTKKQ